jgi:hypothetical protein
VQMIILVRANSHGAQVMRARKEKSGFIARKGEQCLTIAFYTEPTVDTRIANNVVEALADYLEQMGY